MISQLGVLYTGCLFNISKLMSIRWFSFTDVAVIIGKLFSPYGYLVFKWKTIWLNIYKAYKVNAYTLCLLYSIAIDFTWEYDLTIANYMREPWVKAWFAFSIER